MPRYHIWKELDEHTDDLVSAGLVNSDRVQIALEKQKEKPEQSLCEILVAAGFIDPAGLVEFIGKYLDVPVVDPTVYQIDPAVIAHIPAYLARQYTLIPFELQGQRLRVVIADPRNEIALTELVSTYPGEIEICVGLDENIKEAVISHYSRRDLKKPTLAEVQIQNFDAIAEQQQLSEGNMEVVGNIVDNLLTIALDEKASDLHLDPISAGLKVRLRIDGTLHEQETIDKNHQMGVISKIKVMGGLDISERRVPQDGRVRVGIGERMIDLRIATYPTMWGEKVSIRVLTKDVFTSLAALGLSEANQKSFEEIITQPHGLFLVTGPTGSGKTTSLYSAFMKINRLDRNAISIEDPIENEISGVNQGQVNVKAGITFSSALRSMLRHDPDIILVGEIRDGETADITARAAMTGHLVFSTLHTNSAVGAVARLRDLGLASFLIASSLIGVMAQRLIRKLCPHCKEVYEPTQEEITLTQGKVSQFYRSKGCEACRNTGFSGRTGVYELFPLDETIRVAITNDIDEHELTDLIRKKGCLSMLDDGFDKVNQGVTSLEEVMRVCRSEES